MPAPTLPAVDPVLDALARDPVRPPLHRPHPRADPVDRPWRTFADLADVPAWADVADRYARAVGTAHRAVGGACALQHWSGDWLALVLPVWLRTGALLDLSADRWWVWWDARGMPAGLALDAAVAAVAPAPADVAVAVVAAARPVVDAVSAATRITPKLAWGSVATSCAGVLATVHRSLAPPRRAAFADLAEAVLDAPAWPHRPLLSPVLVEADDGLRLAHRRHTCCLIRLGGSRACASCRDLPADERDRRTTAAVRRLDPGPETPLWPGLTAAGPVSGRRP
ncbi:IucA/IucC family C-terminal-domain containing protein [Microlunatus capsulatus]|uniref:Ferric siderophore reductase C-terminal domain-containing protein n=1 Tax=Microlunatus capsulatus TaxID=99117 RepID=A0ABS4Z276_9ACTN|nr:IucA/IucC family C-terminal-domain containing protein [Microlunatus capsulatus]MBP2415135.1 hypothetical protein [Microlunatus capsulatus]